MAANLTVLKRTPSTVKPEFVEYYGENVDELLKHAAYLIGDIRRAASHGRPTSELVEKALLESGEPYTTVLALGDLFTLLAHWTLQEGNRGYGYWMARKYPESEVKVAAVKPRTFDTQQNGA